MKNKNLFIVLGCIIFVLAGCQSTKQNVNSDILVISGDSGEKIQKIEKEEYDGSKITLAILDYYPSGEQVYKYELSGMKNLNSQKIINDRLTSLYNDVVAECEKIKSGDVVPSLECNVTCNNEYYFSFCIAKKISAKNETYVKEFYVIDKKAGELLKLSDFYNDSNYLNEISQKMYAEYDERKNLSGDNGYFYNLSEKDFYGKLQIDSRNFYISPENELVYYFQKYEIGNGKVGEQEFVLIENIENK